MTESVEEGSIEDGPMTVHNPVRIVDVSRLDVPGSEAGYDGRVEREVMAVLFEWVGEGDRLELPVELEYACLVDVCGIAVSSQSPVVVDASLPGVAVEYTSVGEAGLSVCPYAPMCVST